MRGNLDEIREIIYPSCQGGKIICEIIGKHKIRPILDAPIPQALSWSFATFLDKSLPINKLYI